ncbi:MAG: sigma-54-dependent Fis family transcriptional regulator [Burkholderiales bacterium]|nr:sigma-54-dependent Fis family transcriptional regulator [Burkholderiales bacterium]
MNEAPRLLLVEDDEDLRFALCRLLGKHRYDVETVGTGATALAAVRARSFDVVLLDLGLPDRPGVEVLAEIVALDAALPVVVLTGRDEAASAVRALRAGAFQYLTKPTASEEILLAVEQARERSRLARRVEAEERAGLDAGVGESWAFRRALAEVRAAAAAPRTPVLVRGESGTGKERCSRLIHAYSERARGPFVTVNAACFSPSLLESELFGHEAGAFTGARGTKRGVFELAAGGTLFLDEVGELPLDLQPKLLRVLEGHPFRRLGGEREIRADVRLVSATHRALDAEVEAGRFRLDLYHRLRVVEIALPPLRERAEDIALLTQHFVARIAAELGRPPLGVTPAALAALRAYAWPGNVRELRNVIERAIVLRTGGDLDLRDLPREVMAAAPGPQPDPMGADAPPMLSLEAAIQRHVIRAFQRCGNNLSLTARVLGISRMTLRKRLREAAIEADDAEPS